MLQARSHADSGAPVKQPAARAGTDKEHWSGFTWKRRCQKVARLLLSVCALLRSHFQEAPIGEKQCCPVGLVRSVVRGIAAVCRSKTADNDDGLSEAIYQPAWRLTEDFLGRRLN